MKSLVSNVNKLIFSFLLATQPAFAAVSLLQETKEIECKFAAKSAPFEKIVIEKKDDFIRATKSDRVEKYERLKFLDSALLAQTKNEVAFFQVLPNGEAWFTTGELLELKEKDCDDTGASKTCKTDKIKSLFWSPEKLSLKRDKQSFDIALDTYGFLANHATYFRSIEKKGPSSLTLIDYGSSLELLVGKSYQAECNYLP